ncbi:MAG TPA: MYG1 family protein [Arenibaculum sp.]|nr:MYG1 family protein [Arenibaculum sp.]
MTGLSPVEPQVHAATHGGTYLADEVTAYAVVALAEPDRVPGSFRRTRAPEVIARADIVFDVGGVYAPERHRYDHHMRKAPKRPDGTPYSSAGLIWKAFGHAALRAILGAMPGDRPAELLDRVWQQLDQMFFLPIDRIDNGVQGADELSYVTLIDDCNPNWTDAEDDEDAAFLRAAAIAEVTLRRKAARVLAHLLADGVVREAAARAEDPRILELPTNLPWQHAIFEAELPVLFVLYCDPEGLWRIDGVPKERGSRQLRRPLPKSWAGLRDAELQRASGIADAAFVHPARVTGGARSRAGVKAMAQAAIAQAKSLRTRQRRHTE